MSKSEDLSRLQDIVDRMEAIQQDSDTRSAAQQLKETRGLISQAAYAAASLCRVERAREIDRVRAAFENAVDVQADALLRDFTHNRADIDAAISISRDPEHMNTLRRMIKERMGYVVEVMADASRSEERLRAEQAKRDVALTEESGG